MNKILLSFDTDWAPDFVIEKITNILIKKKIKSTWFITHSSPEIDKIKKKTCLKFCTKCPRRASRLLYLLLEFSGDVVGLRLQIKAAYSKILNTNHKIDIAK